MLTWLNPETTPMETPDPTPQKHELVQAISRVLEEEDLPQFESTTETTMDRRRAQCRLEGTCFQCGNFGDNLLKCLRCPVAFHTKECLGYLFPYRGKWLCYFCKVLKQGLVNERKVIVMPNEPRPLKKLAQVVNKNKD